MMKGIVITKSEFKRFLDASEAALYLGMGVKEFKRECAVLPIERARGRRVYDVVKLDQWADEHTLSPEAMNIQAKKEAGLARLQ
jgi:hypothetical protein